MQSLQKSLAGLRADGATGLYDTVIAAAAAAQNAWREGNNTIVLISDGKNEDPGAPRSSRCWPSRATRRHRAGRILSIALGGEADAVTLRRLADAAKGEAYVAREAQDLGKVFLAADRLSARSGDFRLTWPDLARRGWSGGRGGQADGMPLPR